MSTHLEAPELNQPIRLGAPVKDWRHLAAFTESQYTTYLLDSHPHTLIWHQPISSPPNPSLSQRHQPSHYQPQRYHFLCANIQSKEQAQPYQGWSILSQRHHPPTSLAECLWSDLYGCDVYDINEVYVGIITHIANHGATDIVEIHSCHEPQARPWTLPLHANLLQLIPPPLAQVAQDDQPVPQLKLQILHPLSQLEDYRN